MYIFIPKPKNAVCNPDCKNEVRIERLPMSVWPQSMRIATHPITLNFWIVWQVSW